jgi:hypothetical protein
MNVIEDKERKPIAKDPGVYNKEMTIQRYFQIYEMYLSQFNRKYWRDDLDRRLPVSFTNEIQVNPNWTYEELKAQVTEKFKNEKEVKAVADGPLDNLTEFLQRKQSMTESVKDFANQLQQLAKKAFSSMNEIDIEDRIIENFINNIYLETIQNELTIKKASIRAQGNRVTLKELVEIAADLEVAYKKKLGKSEQLVDDIGSRASVYSEPGNLSQAQLDHIKKYLKEVNAIEVQSTKTQNEEQNRKSNSEKNFKPASPNGKPQANHHGCNGGPNRQKQYEQSGNYNQSWNNGWNKGNRDYQNKPQQKQNTNASWQKQNEAHKLENNVVLNNIPTKPGSSSNRIIGSCIINDVLAKYLCDEGADKTVISRKLYDSMKIKSTLSEFKGQIKSCSGQLVILGKLVVETMIIDPTIRQLEGIEVLVVEHQSSNEVLLGRDIMVKVPKLRETLDNKRKIVEKMSVRVEELFKQNQLENSRDIVMEGQMVDLLLSKLVQKEGEINSISLEELGSRIESMVDSIAASSLNDLTPSNANKCHVIELINKDQRPFRQKMRPIPYSQKEAFRKVIDQQLEARLIQKSNSPFRSPVNLVMKPDGNIRVTSCHPNSREPKSLLRLIALAAFTKSS